MRRFCFYLRATAQYIFTVSHLKVFFFPYCGCVKCGEPGNKSVTSESPPITVSICQKTLCSLCRYCFCFVPCGICRFSFPFLFIFFLLLWRKAARAHLLCRNVGATSVPAGGFENFRHKTAYMQTREHKFKTVEIIIQFEGNFKNQKMVEHFYHKIMGFYLTMGPCDALRVLIFISNNCLNFTKCQSCS